MSYHVLESSDVAHALVRYAEGNHVNMMILGAATHGLQTQRFIATVPMRVARDAPCTVILVEAVAAVCAPGGCQLSTGSENGVGRAAACRQRGARQ